MCSESYWFCRKLKKNCVFQKNRMTKNVQQQVHKFILEERTNVAGMGVCVLYLFVPFELYWVGLLLRVTWRGERS